MLACTWFLTIIMYPVAKSLICLTFFQSYLCIILLSETNMLNISLFINRSGDAASKRYMDFCNSEFPSLDHYDESLIGNVNSLPISATYQAMHVPKTPFLFVGGVLGYVRLHYLLNPMSPWDPIMWRRSGGDFPMPVAIISGINGKEGGWDEVTSRIIQVIFEKY